MRLLLAALCLTLLPATAAEAHDRRLDGRHHKPRHAFAPSVVVIPIPDPIQGVGCYWARQREICARYCYWQPDGRRYCTERSRQARREYVPVEPLLPLYEWPMK